MAKKRVAEVIGAVGAHDTNSTVESVLESILTKLQSAGGFGQSSIDLEIDIGEQGTPSRLSLKVTSAASTTAAGVSSAMDLGAQPEFNSEGHHVIALIAQRDLSEGSPSTLK